MTLYILSMMTARTLGSELTRTTPTSRQVVARLLQTKWYVVHKSITTFATLTNAYM